jgi:hypothetical protein
MLNQINSAYAIGLRIKDTLPHPDALRNNGSGGHLPAFLDI